MTPEGVRTEGPVGVAKRAAHHWRARWRRSVDDGYQASLAVLKRVASLSDNTRLVRGSAAQLAEVRYSRRRIIEAADADRRRVERNIHDVVQQRLVAALLLLRRALDARDGTDLQRQGIEQVDLALAELREIARGLHPPTLSERGLAGAIEALAERASIPVELDDGVGLTQISRATAATAYYVVSEAVANTQRHADATWVRVRLRLLRGRLVIAVLDDGHGGARLVEGGGLMGLRDRVEAMGGDLRLSDTAVRGTLLVATIPLGERR